jgi:type I restriction enzyme S subunit
VQLKLTQRALNSIELSCPPPSEQRRIADVLGTFDDKIDSNRRLASLLEEVTAEVFRARCINFGGVSEFTEVDGVRIPSGWTRGTIHDLARLRYGKALRADNRVPGQVTVVGSSGVVGTHNVPLVDGPVVVVGRKGHVGSVTWVGGDAWPIDTTFIAEPVAGVGPAFLYFLLANANLPNLVSDSGVPGLIRTEAEEQQVAVPPAAVIAEFGDFASRVLEQKDQLDAECRTLASIRDVLLPKLISGRIRVRGTTDVEEEVHAAS